MTADPVAALRPASPHYVNGAILRLTDHIELHDGQKGTVMAFHAVSGWPVVFFGAHCKRVPGEVNPNLIKSIIAAERPAG